MTTNRPTRTTALLTLQRAMVQRLKRRMKYYVEQTPELKAYVKRYQDDVKDVLVVSYPDEMVESVVHSRVAYVGDFHTLLPAQTFLVRLLDKVLAHPAANGRPIIVAMEAFQRAHQPHLDDYLQDRLEFPQLLERCAYRRNWGFPVEGYQRIVDTCKEKGLPILAINSSPRGEDPLARRDRQAARLIARTLKQTPDALVLVFIGDLHVAQPHLPAHVSKLLPEPLTGKTTIIYSNPDDIYWWLTEQGLDYMVNVVKLGSQRFAVVNATPVAKFESYLRFVEDVIDDRAWSDEDELLAPLDVEEHTADLAGRIVQFLGLRDFSLPEFELVTFSHTEETVAEMAARFGAPQNESGAIASSLKARQVTFVGPYGVFIQQFAFNDIADLAARLVLKTLGWEKSYGRSRAAFFQDVIYEALVYFATKAINPKRTCKRAADLARWVDREAQLARHTGTENPLLRIVGRSVVPHLQALQHALNKNAPESFHCQRRWWQMGIVARLQATRLLGARLGERLFYSAQVGLPDGWVQEGRTRQMTLAQVVEVMRQGPCPDGDARERYLALWFDTADVVEHHQARDDWF